MLTFALKLKLLCTFQYQDPVPKHNIIRTVLQHKKAKPKKAVLLEFFSKGYKKMPGTGDDIHTSQIFNTFLG